MRITKYATKIDRDTRRSVLVKEKAVNYSACKNLKCPSLIVNAMNDLFDLDVRDEEYVYMIGMNTKSDVTGIFEIGHGIVDACIVQPREIFKNALLVGAAKIVIIHNHPAGNAEPSEADKRVTKRIKESGQLLGLPLLDHIIIGYRDYYSFAENDML